MNKAYHKELYDRVMAPTVLFLAVLIVWQLTSTSGLVPTYILPSPLNVIWALAQNSAILLNQTLLTSLEAISGFAAAFVGALALAVAIVESRLIDRAITPFLGILQSIPIIAIAPLLVLWFGPGIFGRILLAALVAFFPLVLNLVAGFRSVEEDPAMLMSLLKATRSQRYRYLQIPAAGPFAFAGFKTAAALSVVGAIVAEFLLPVAGLGQVIVIASYQLNTPLMFAAVTMSAFLAVVFVGVFRLVEARIIFWHPSIRQQHNGNTK